MAGFPAKIFVAGKQLFLTKPDNNYRGSILFFMAIRPCDPNKPGSNCQAERPTYDTPAQQQPFAKDEYVEVSKKPILLALAPQAPTRSGSPTTKGKKTEEPLKPWQPLEEKDFIGRSRSEKIPEAVIDRTQGQVFSAPGVIKKFLDESTLRFTLNLPTGENTEAPLEETFFTSEKLTEEQVRMIISAFEKAFQYPVIQKPSNNPKNVLKAVQDFVEENKTAHKEINWLQRLVAIDGEKKIVPDIKSTPLVIDPKGKRLLNDRIATVSKNLYESYRNVVAVMMALDPSGESPEEEIILPRLVLIMQERDPEKAKTKFLESPAGKTIKFQANKDEENAQAFASKAKGVLQNWFKQAPPPPPPAPGPKFPEIVVMKDDGTFEACEGPRPQSKPTVTNDDERYKIFNCPEKQIDLGLPPLEGVEKPAITVILETTRDQKTNKWPDWQIKIDTFNAKTLSLANAEKGLLFIEKGGRKFDLIPKPDFDGLIADLTGEDAKKSKEAEKTLVKLGALSVKPIVAKIASLNPEELKDLPVASKLIQNGLGAIPGEEANQALIQIIKETKFVPIILEATVNALGNRKAKSALEVLSALHKDESKNQRLREEAAQAVQKISGANSAESKEAQISLEGIQKARAEAKRLAKEEEKRLREEAKAAEAEEKRKAEEEQKRIAEEKKAAEAEALAKAEERKKDAAELAAMLKPAEEPGKEEEPKPVAEPTPEPVAVTTPDAKPATIEGPTADAGAAPTSSTPTTVASATPESAPDAGPIEPLDWDLDDLPLDEPTSSTSSPDAGTPVVTAQPDGGPEVPGPGLGPREAATASEEPATAKTDAGTGSLGAAIVEAVKTSTPPKSIPQPPELPKVYLQKSDGSRVACPTIRDDINETNRNASFSCDTTAATRVVIASDYENATETWTRWKFKIGTGAYKSLEPGLDIIVKKERRTWVAKAEPPKAAAPAAAKKIEPDKTFLLSDPHSPQVFVLIPSKDNKEIVVTRGDVVQNTLRKEADSYKVTYVCNNAQGKLAAKILFEAKANAAANSWDWSWQLADRGKVSQPSAKKSFRSENDVGLIVYWTGKFWDAVPIDAEVSDKDVNPKLLELVKTKIGELLVPKKPKPTKTDLSVIARNGKRKASRIPCDATGTPFNLPAGKGEFLACDKNNPEEGDSRLMALMESAKVSAGAIKYWTGEKWIWRVPIETSSGEPVTDIPAETGNQVGFTRRDKEIYIFKTDDDLFDKMSAAGVFEGAPELKWYQTVDGKTYKPMLSVQTDIIRKGSKQTFQSKGTLPDGSEAFAEFERDVEITPINKDVIYGVSPWRSLTVPTGEREIKEGNVMIIDEPGKRKALTFDTAPERDEILQIQYNQRVADQYHHRRWGAKFGISATPWNHYSLTPPPLGGRSSSEATVFHAEAGKKSERKLETADGWGGQLNASAQWYPLAGWGPTANGLFLFGGANLGFTSGPLAEVEAGLGISLKHLLLLNSSWDASLQASLVNAGYNPGTQLHANFGLPRVEACVSKGLWQGCLNFTSITTIEKVPTGELEKNLGYFGISVGAYLEEVTTDRINVQ